MNKASAPPASRVNHTVARLDTKFSAHEVHLRGLRVLQRGIGRREIRAGIQHLAIKPQTVEVVAEIVVVMNVLSRGTRIVRLLPEPPGPTPGGPESPVDLLEEPEQIAPNLNGAGHVRFAEIQFGIPDPAQESRAVSKENRREGRPRQRWQLEPIPQTQVHGRPAETLPDSSEQPSIERRRRKLSGFAEVCRNVEGSAAIIPLRCLTGSLSPPCLKRIGQKDPWSESNIDEPSVPDCALPAAGRHASSGHQSCGVPAARRLARIRGCSGAQLRPTRGRRCVDSCCC
jgi:hypothetical protein